MNPKRSQLITGHVGMWVICGVVAKVNTVKLKEN